jgi:hypothetical protein
MPLWWGEAPKEPTASTEASSFDRPKNVFSPENAPRPWPIAPQRLGGFLCLTSRQSDEHLPFAKVVSTFGSLAPPKIPYCFPSYNNLGA